MSNIFKDTYKYLSSYRKIAKVNIKTPDYQTVDREDFNKTINELLSFASITENSINSLNSNYPGYIEFTYDINGNLTTKTAYSSITNLIINLIATYSYDVNGNLTNIIITKNNPSVTVIKTFTYDINNNLININIT